MSSRNPKGGKSGSPKVIGRSRKSEVGSPKLDEKNTSADTYRGDIRHSVITEPPIAPHQTPPEKELQTANSKLQTETMEVHHHPQLEHKPKPWKEYLLEGLMIFLAVTMGFFAESLREHITNNEREEQYVRSMIEDLKDDRSKLEIHIKSLKQNRDMLDSLITILNDPASIPQHGNEIYYFGRIAPRYPILLLNMRTYEQLKNSGSFRLISKLDVSNHIMSYYGKIPYLRQIEDLYVEEFANYKKLAGNVFEPAELRKHEDNVAGVIRGTDNPPLQKNAPAFYKEMAINTIYMNGSRKQIISNEEDLLASADQLLNYLKKNYNLENE